MTPGQEGEQKLTAVGVPGFGAAPPTPSQHSERGIPQGDEGTALRGVKVGVRVRHGRTGDVGTVVRVPRAIGLRPGDTVGVEWDSHRVGGAFARDLLLVDDRECSICGDTEPFHVHHGDQRIEDYFTVGRRMSDFEAATAWRERALRAERLLREREGGRS